MNLLDIADGVRAAASNMDGDRIADAALEPVAIDAPPVERIDAIARHLSLINKWNRETMEECRKLALSGNPIAKDALPLLVGVTEAIASMVRGIDREADMRSEEDVRLFMHEQFAQLRHVTHARLVEIANRLQAESMLADEGAATPDDRMPVFVIALKLGVPPNTLRDWLQAAKVKVFPSKTGRKNAHDARISDVERAIPSTKVGRKAREKWEAYLRSQH